MYRNELFILIFHSQYYFHNASTSLVKNYLKQLRVSTTS